MANQVPIMLLQAKHALRQGKKEIARQLLDQIILSEPRNALAWLLLAEAVIYPNEREDCAKQVLEIDPDNMQAKKIIANHQLSYKKMGEFEEIYDEEELWLENEKDTGKAWGLGGLVVGTFVFMFVFLSQNSPGNDSDRYLLFSLSMGGIVTIGVWAVGAIRSLRKS